MKPSAECHIYDWASVFKEAKDDGHVIVLADPIENVGTYYYEDYIGTISHLVGKKCFTIRAHNVEYTFVSTDPKGDINQQLLHYPRYKTITPDGLFFSYLKVKVELFERLLGGDKQQDATANIQWFKITTDQLADDEPIPAARQATEKPAIEPGAKPTTQQRPSIPDMANILAHFYALAKIAGDRRNNFDENGHDRAKADDPISCDVSEELIRSLKDELNEEMYMSHERFTEKYLYMADQAWAVYRNHEKSFSKAELDKIILMSKSLENVAFAEWKSLIDNALHVANSNKPLLN